MTSGYEITRAEITYCGGGIAVTPGRSGMSSFTRSGSDTRSTRTT